VFDIVVVLERREQCRELRCAMEERRAFSGGERMEEGDEWSAVRSGEGWPERERRISWSMVGVVVCLQSFGDQCSVDGKRGGDKRRSVSSFLDLVDQILGQQQNRTDELEAAH
jgi:hypothetical protein